jgi:hypothetical protein
MSAIEILAVTGIIGYVIVRQVQGEPLRGKRTVLLPAVLTVIGLLNLRSGGTRLTGADMTCLVVGTAGSAVIGLAFGTVTRLRARLAAWRVAVMLLASGMHAHAGASSATLLFGLGVSRLAQAAVIVVRAMATGVPFAPEKDGRVFMADTFSRSPGSRDFNGGSSSQGTRGSQDGCKRRGARRQGRP